MQRTAFRSLALTAAAITALGVLSAVPAIAAPTHSSARVTADSLDDIRDLGDDGIVVPALGADPLGAVSGTSNAARLAAATPAVHDVYVVVVNATATSNDTEYTTSDLSDTKIKAAIATVSDFWNDQSGGIVTLKTKSIGRVSLKASYCDPEAIFDREERTAFGGRFANGAWVTTHDHLLILTSEGEACGEYAGFGYIGAGNGVIFSANGLDDEYGVPVLRHEFGHNMGFGHADSGVCKSTVNYDSYLSNFAYAGRTCVVEPYGDLADIMGYTSPFASMNLSMLERIRAGWLSSGIDYRSVTKSTPTVTQTLQSVGSESGMRALKIQDPRSGEYYVIEYRASTGKDATSLEFVNPTTTPCDNTIAGSDGEGNPITISMGSYYRCYADLDPTEGGVRVMREIIQGAGNHETVALAVGLTDQHAGNKRYRHDALTTGESFHSVTGGFTLTVNSADATAGAGVTVAFAPTATTAVTLTANRSTQKYGAVAAQRSTLTAHVNSVAGTYARGSISFYDGTRRLATLSVSSTGNAKYTLPAAFSVGSHRLTAKFTPAHSGYSASTSNGKTITVSR